MSARKPARLKKLTSSKLPGSPDARVHNVGTKCVAQRNDSNPGQWILWFGSRRYATVDAVKLHDTVEFI